MNKTDILKFFNGIGTGIAKNSPAILTGFAIVSGGASVILAIEATPKALKRIDAKKQELNVDKLTTLETIKTAGSCYIPAALSFGFAAGCAIGSQSINASRHAALATAYKISETALVEYRDKVVETIGEKKEQTVRDKVAQEQINKTPVNQREVIITGKGTSLCLDPFSKRYFESDIETIRRAENKLNKAMMQSICGSTSLNEFYAEIGLDSVDDAIGYQLGWNAENQIDLDIRPGMTPDERPCLVIGHYNPPKYGY